MTLLQLTRHQIFVDKGVICLVLFADAKARFDHAFIESTSPWTHCVIVAFVDWACFCFALNVSRMRILLQRGGGCGAKNKCTYIQQT